MKIPAELLSQQIAAVFRAWGMTGEQVDITVQLMLAADLRGIDSHGVATLSLYNDFRTRGKLTLNPEIKIVRETPVIAIVDGGGGLGHYPSFRAMNLAIEKCATHGLAAVGVRNSTHFGAAGVYALRAAERGFIGFVTSAVWRPGVVPTFGAEPMFGTNPIAFAAPAGKHPPFCLDMATSTVAIGKIKLAALHGKPIREGWANDDAGNCVTDAAQAMQHVCLTPLGGLPEMSSHKGYGLGAMVEIFSSLLTGAAYAVTRARREPDAERYNVGHFFLALDPKMFRGDEDFPSELDDLIEALHGTKRADENQPVLVPGEPEDTIFATRSRDGIPLSTEQSKSLHALADASGAAWLLNNC